MDTLLLEARSPQSIAGAVEALRRGAVIALPTDTVYGVGATAFNPQAVAQIFALKNRPPEKAIPVFVPSIAALPQVCRPIPKAARALLSRYWPGALTVILPAHPSLPGIITNYGRTVAVRMPNHPVVMALLAELGEPLAVTSANLSGRPTPKTAGGVQKEFAGRLPLVLDDGPSPADTPSTIIDLTCVPPGILRQGSLVIPPESPYVR